MNKSNIKTYKGSHLFVGATSSMKQTLLQIDSLSNKVVLYFILELNNNSGLF